MIVITGFGRANSLGASIARSLKDSNPDIKILAVVDYRIRMSDVSQGWDEIIFEDLLYPMSWDRILEKCMDYEITGLINSAGANHMDWIKNISYNDYSRIMKVNLDAPIFLTKAIDGIMSNGFILNICSMGARKPFRTSMPYNVSKAALVMATKQMARELYPESGNVIFGISPNQIEGSGMTIDNEKSIHEVRGWTKEEADRYRLSGMLVKEDTTINQLTGFITYLLSKRENYIQFCGMEIQYGD